MILTAFLGLVAFLGSSAPAASADECPNEALRVGFSAQLPECRAYERVSPADKGGVDITPNSILGIFVDNIIGADQAGAVSFPSWLAFGDAVSSPALSTYIAKRTAAGWQTHSANPPIKAGLFATGLLARGLTSDLSKGILDGPSASAENPNPLNLVDLASRQMTPIAEPTEGETSVPGFANDMSHVVVRSTAPLTPDSPAGNSSYLYDWTQAGGLLNLGRLPDNSLVSGNVEPADGSYSPMNHQVSDDGSRVFFLVAGEPETGGQLYVRENGNTTKYVSAPAPGAPAEAERPAKFLFASADGSSVFFCSSQRLTADSTAIPGASPDLYRYQVDSSVLTDITVTDDPEGARVCRPYRTIVGGATDGSRIYFTASGKLTSAAPADNEPKIYVWHDDGTTKGELTYVTSIPVENLYLASGQQRNGARVSPNGRWLAFVFDPENDESFNVYRYDAIADELVCASCNPAGATHSGLHGFSFSGGESDPAHIERSPNNLLDDGRLFFESKDALVPQDINNEWDVYEYVDGQRYLISSGTDTASLANNRDVFFGDASLDGTDVYFETRTQLVPSDTDNLLDVYTARVDGGFKSDLAPPPPNCNGEACKPPPVTASASPGAGSAVFAGSGNQGRKLGSPTSRKHKRCGKRKGARKCHKSRHANANRGGSK